jgi:hypothetical protein
VPRRLPILALSLALALAPAPRAGVAGGFLKVSPGGVIYRWDARSMLPLDLDGGPLGGLEGAEARALVEDAMTAWEQPTLELGFATTSNMLTEDGDGDGDGDVSTAGEFQALVANLQGGTTAIRNAIVFDHDASVIQAHFGVGADTDILGFAMILRADDTSFHITHAVQVYNGACVLNEAACGAEQITREDLTDTVVHEQGHVLNLDHVQVNGQWFFGDTDDPGFALYGAPPGGAGAVNVMFPFYLHPQEIADDLGRDELAAAEHLYGKPGSPATGVISGTVYRSDGITPLQGVNVIARNTDNTSYGAFFDATSSVSGYRFPTTSLAGSTPSPPCPSATPPQRHGDFDLLGLTPGETYTVEAVQVTSQFVCGSSVGPLERPLAFPDEEFYDAEESSTDDTTPATFTPIPIPANGSPVVTGIDLIQNCGKADDTIDAQTIGGFAYFDACVTLTAGAGVEISSSGDAVFAAGERVVLAPGFRVAAGGRLVVRPQLR